MQNLFNYRIGLDIGIASVGWAVLLNNSKDEPVHIIDLGVRVFDKAENPKTGASLAAPRREKRSSRRRIRRKKHRVTRIKMLLEKVGMIQREDFEQRFYQANLPNVYELRVKGLDTLLTNEEFAQILVFFANHRGFKSNRKSDSKDQETGKQLSAIRENQLLMEKNGYRTVGEMILLDPMFHEECSWSKSGSILTARNKQGDYKYTFLRSAIVDEVISLFNAQREAGNIFATKEWYECQNC